MLDFYKCAEKPDRLAMHFSYFLWVFLDKAANKALANNDLIEKIIFSRSIPDIKVMRYVNDYFGKEFLAGASVKINDYTRVVLKKNGSYTELIEELNRVFFNQQELYKTYVGKNFYQYFSEFKIKNKKMRVCILLAEMFCVDFNNLSTKLLWDKTNGK